MAQGSVEFFLIHKECKMLLGYVQSLDLTLFQKIV